jgi:hypothetical protein
MHVESGNPLHYIQTFQIFSNLKLLTIQDIAIQLMGIVYSSVPGHKVQLKCLHHRSHEALNNCPPNIEIAYKFVRNYNPKVN